MRSGTYRGVSDELTVEIRVDPAGTRPAVSGDINVRSTFVASFIAITPKFGDDMVSGTVQFRGNPRLFTGTIDLKADDRGVGVFQLGVDLEGGFKDVIAGRAEWSSMALIRFRGHVPKGGYDVPHVPQQVRPASSPAVH